MTMHRTAARSLLALSLLGVGACQVLVGLEDGVLRTGGGAGGTAGGGAGDGGSGNTGNGGGGTGNTGGGGTSSAGGGGTGNAGGGTSGGGGSGGNVIVINGGPLPDSPTVFCTDGTQALDECPSPGDPAFGQDGNYWIDVPTYQSTLLVSEDSVSRLVWQRSLSTWITHAAAATLCDELTLAQQTDWRLPSFIEMATVMDYGRFDPTIDVIAFPNVVSDAIWAAEPHLSAPDKVWFAEFHTGAIGSQDSTVTHQSFCVRGSPYAGSFEALPEVVRDPRTERVWQREIETVGKSWLAALDYCRLVAEAGLGGYTDWRLPNAKELLTLVDPTRSGPCIDTTLFPATNTVAFWTSTPSAADPTKSFMVHFNSGFTMAVPTTDDNWVRCVRGP